MIVLTIRADRFHATYACPCGGAFLDFMGAEQRTCPACHAVYALSVRVDRVRRPPTQARVPAQEVRGE